MTILFSLILSFTEMLAFSFIADILLVRKKKTFSSFYLTLACATVIAFFVSLFLQSISPILKNFIAIGVFYVASLICYNGSNKFNLFVCIVYFVAICTLDYVLLYGFFIIFSLSYEAFFASTTISYTFSIFAKLILFLLAFFLQKLLRLRKTKNTYSAPFAWLLLIVPVFSIINLVIVLDNALKESDTNFWIFVSAFGLLASNIVMGLMWDKLENESQLQLKSTLLEQEIKNTMDKTIALESLYTSQRSATHEFKNQINVLQGLLDLKSYAHATTYIHQLTEKMNRQGHIVHANHPLVDVVLNQKYDYAKQKGIVTSFIVSDLSMLHIKASDMITILTNVLDNAIEAAEKCPSDKEIRVKIEIKNDNSVFISVINTALFTIISDNTVKTSKKSELEHGFGLQNIKQIVDFYSGEMLLKYEDGYFKLFIILY